MWRWAAGLARVVCEGRYLCGVDYDLVCSLKAMLDNKWLRDQRLVMKWGRLAKGVGVYGSWGVELVEVVVGMGST